MSYTVAQACSVMIDVTVEGYKPAHELMKTNRYTKIISLVDINSPCASTGDNHLVVTVTDIVEIPERFRKPYINPKMLPVLPAAEHVQAVLAHTAALQDGDSLLVHCSRGKSRSAAMAWAVLIQHGMTFEEGFAHLKAIRPEAMPNQLMVSHIDQHFALGGQMLSFYNEWYKRQIGIHNIIP
jgi:predicted protein tyrosine phosphatase